MIAEVLFLHAYRPSRLQNVKVEIQTCWVLKSHESDIGCEMS